MAWSSPAIVPARKDGQERSGHVAPYLGHEFLQVGSYVPKPLRVFRIFGVKQADGERYVSLRLAYLLIQVLEPCAGSRQCVSS
jgi:hypothetical protein